MFITTIILGYITFFSYHLYNQTLYNMITNAINFDKIEIKKGVMHHIVAKGKEDEYAAVNYEPSTFTPDANITTLIRERLVTASGKKSKAFELKIGDFSTGSFFDHIKDLKSANDAKFFSASKKIADLLAQSQTTSIIPGGVFILLNCIDKAINKTLFIVIKAELHKAATSKTVKGHTSLQVLNEIFLSPSQRLYKVGIIYEREDKSKTYPNDSYTCFLFDEQFRTDGKKPAEYFYKTFLGFSIDENSQIQIKRFYDNSHSFITNYVSDHEEKIDLLNALKNELLLSTEEAVTPFDFGKKYIKDDELLDLYVNRVSNGLPPSIAKDTILVKNQLSRKTLVFPNSIKITGEAESFDANVSLIKSNAELKRIALDDEYTIIKIKGKPFSKND